MRVVVAPDKFKGSLTAAEAAEAIGEGLRQGRPGLDVVLAPVADGGDGTVDAAVAAGYERVTTTVAGPTGANNPITAKNTMAVRRCTFPEFRVVRAILFSLIRLIRTGQHAAGPHGCPASLSTRYHGRQSREPPPCRSHCALRSTPKGHRSAYSAYNRNLNRLLRDP